MPEEVYNICRDEELCPYKVTRLLTRYSEVIIGNYNYIFVDTIRRSILGRVGIKVEDVNCVFDEAHSLPYYAAGMLSDELSSLSVKKSAGRVRDFGLDDFNLLNVLHNLILRFGKSVYRKIMDLTLNMPLKRKNLSMHY